MMTPSVSGGNEGFSGSTTTSKKDPLESSMTLAISHENAKRMLESSCAFNNTLSRLKSEKKKLSKDTSQASVNKSTQNPDDNEPLLESTLSSRSIKEEQASSPQTENETSLQSNHTSSPSFKNATESTPINKFLVPAALSSQNDLLVSYVTQMQNSHANGVLSMSEMEVSLLLFLDMDKSNKLLSAFKVLSESPTTNVQRDSQCGHNSTASPKKIDEDSDIVMLSKIKGEDQQGNDESELMSGVEYKSNGNHKNDTDISNGSTDPSLQLPTLDQKSLMKLFKCLLSSISTCIHHKETNGITNNCENKSRKAMKQGECTSPSSSVAPKMSMESPTNDENAMKTSPDLKSEKKDDLISLQKDWNLSSETYNEIHEIATYATDRVVEYMQTKKHEKIGKSSITTESKCEDSIDFQAFGDWYNSGGFSLVPWLELLDLAKWDYSGRATVAAAAASAAKNKHVVRSSRQQNTHHSDQNRMNPIMEQNTSDMRGNVPSSFTSSALPPENSIKNDRFKSNRHQSSPENMNNLFFNSPRKTATTRTLISFDFGGSKKHSLHISAENLTMMRNLVQKTSLCRLSPGQLTKILLRHSKRRRIPVSSSATRGQPRLEEVMMIMTRQDFGRCIRDLVPPEASREFTETETETFSNFLTNFFLCFGRINCNSAVGLDVENVNVRELAVGFSFLCAGNKSVKLGTIFEVIEDQNAGFLSQRKLMRYLRSYLTMLVGISLLSSSTKSTSDTRRALLASDQSFEFYNSLFNTAESGARWTLDHFLRSHDAKMKKNGNRTQNNGMISFEDFALWYTDDGGYKIAPWLEFLDLKKFLALLTDDIREKQYKRDSGPPSSDRNSLDDFYSGPSTGARNRPSRPIHAPYPPAPSADVLFTFPLAKRQSLVVLREDATYVRTVVNGLGLLLKSPEEVWSGLYTRVQENPPPPLTWTYSKHHKSGSGKSIDVDQETFVSALEKIVPKPNKRKRPATSSSSPKDTLTNFFQSFDLDQVDRVAANQLMGGLTLLCGGKKSAKLSFSFGLFDGRTKEAKDGKDGQSLCGKELFYFLRSFLIVMFSCCKQSLDLSAENVGRYISDTANMVTDDVMKYQWRERRSERVDFEQFGEWYNEGGFETAPWLELLDLNKWVLLDEAKSKPKKNGTKTKKSTKERVPKRQHLRDSSKVNKQAGKTKKNSVEAPKKPEVETKDVLHEALSDCPPPPPDDMLDPGSDIFFDDMGMDDIDLFFNDTSGKDKENVDSTLGIDAVGIPDAFPKMEDDEGEVKGAMDQLPALHETNAEQSKQLKFHLLTSDNQSGYVISISPRRVRLLKHLVTESDLFNVNIAAACKKIFDEAEEGKLKKDMFDAAMRKVIALSCTAATKMTTDTQRLLSDLLTSVFSSFDLNNVGEVDARELACGFTVLCGGRKSDKLEYAFELLDEKKNGLFSRADMVLYLQSFLTVLLSISSCAIGRDPAEDILGSLNGTTSSVSRVIGWGSSWATEQIFKSTPADQKVLQGDTELINFDSFADWYTKGGYTNIQWLELLDLRKWVLADSIS